MEKMIDIGTLRGYVHTEFDIDLIERVAKFVIENNTASINTIQTEFGLGFNRASRIIAILEACEIVGPKTKEGRAIIGDNAKLASAIDAIEEAIQKNEEEYNALLIKAKADKIEKMNKNAFGELVKYNLLKHILVDTSGVSIDVADINFIIGDNKIGSYFCGYIDNHIKDFKPIELSADRIETGLLMVSCGNDFGLKDLEKVILRIKAHYGNGISIIMGYNMDSRNSRLHVTFVGV